MRRPGRSAILPRVTGPSTIRVLGPLDLERAGRPLVLGSRLQRRLLLTSVAARGATLAGDRLVEELWGEHPPAAPANALAVEQARAQLTTSPADAARLLDGALGCWRGAAFAEVADGAVRAAYGAEVERLERARRAADPTRPPSPRRTSHSPHDERPEP